jgi:hypothetical protein
MAAAPLLLATCLQALAPVASGTVPVRGDFAAAPCGGERADALRYEAGSGMLRAVRDIAEGETIAAPPLSLLPDVRPGDTLYLVARAGAATVEREVVATQPGRRGRTIFVRTADGRVVSALLPEEGR